MKHKQSLVWFHAASLGDQAAIQALVERAQIEGYGIIRSAVTRAGRKRARECSPDAHLVAPPLLIKARNTFLQYDPPIKMVVLELLELWPHWVRQSECLGIPMVVVNGRISQRTLIAGPLLRSSFRRLSLFLAQTELDADRARSLGVLPERVQVCGNSKYDHLLKPEVFHQQVSASPRSLQICLGALRPEDERALIKHAHLLQGIRALVAPRYLWRCDRFVHRLMATGLRCHRRSDALHLGLKEWIERYQDDGLLVLDSFGELSTVYYDAQVAVIGGTFQRKPHNMIEAALAGCALVVGLEAQKLSLEFESLQGHGLYVQPSLEQALEYALSLRALEIDAWQNRLCSMKRLIGATDRQWQALQALLHAASAKENE